MRLYIVRHSEALPADGNTRDDDRVLSVQGERDAAVLGAMLAACDTNIYTILTSPLRRAVQTAEIVAAQFAEKPALVISSALAPGFSSKGLLEEMTTRSEGGSIVGVGHMPDVARFISDLVSQGGLASIEMKAGAAACISIDGGRPTEARLAWVISPSLLRALTGHTT